MKKVIYLTLFLSIVFACQKEETPNEWTISGEIVETDALTPEITRPLEGINVYLLNAPFTMDSITNWFTKTDILDSALTNKNGFYEFSKLQVGNYTVMPADSTAEYRFDWSESPDPIWVLSDNVKEEYTMNFTTPEPIVENSGSDFKFLFHNTAYCGYFDADSGSTLTGKSIRINRLSRTWAYLGWDWGPKFGWGDWYWVEVKISNYTKVLGIFSVYDFELWEHFALNISQDASGWLRQYKDEFRIQFLLGVEAFSNPQTHQVEWFHYRSHVASEYDISGDMLKSENKFEIDWKEDKLTVNHTN